MDKYITLCSNLENHLEICNDSRTVKYKTECELIQILYEDCIKFRNKRIEKIMIEQRKGENKKTSA